jgi:glycosyltransferase involved in cell wall biosynthesis
MNSFSEFPVKIVFVIRYFHPFMGGLEKKVLNLASQLIQRGISVAVVTSRFRRNWLAHELIKGVPVSRLPSPRIKVFGALVFIFCLFIYLIRKRHQYTIVHAFQVGYSSALAISLGTLLRKKTVLNLSGSGSGGDIQRHRRTPWGIIFLILCRLAARIVVLNRQMTKELRTIFYNDDFIMLIPNGVDLNTYRKNNDCTTLKSTLGIGEEKIILYTGRLSREKGVDFLIRAYATLPVSVLTRLYILGDGPDRQRLLGLIEQLHLGNRVFMISSVDDVSSFLKISDVFVMPSRFEGLSNSILEAMACGVPVIATRVTGNVDLIEDGVTGLLVSPGDVKELAGALLTILTDPETGENLRRRARDMVHHNYNLNTMVERYSNLYKSLT